MKISLERLLIPLRIILALLKPILNLLNYILTPLLNFLDKLTTGLNDLIDLFTGKFNYFLDTLLKGNFKDAFMFLVDEIKKAFFSILNFFIDGANLVIKALNLLPIKDKFELIKKVEISSKDNAGYSNYMNDQSRINNVVNNNNIEVKNQFDIKGDVNDPNGLKKSINQSTKSNWSIELKEVLVAAGH